MQFYTDSLKRGRNIIKAIKEELGEGVISNIEQTDEEVLFRFNSKYMEQLEPYLKPKTNGADRSPFSIKNLPKTKYVIPDEDLVIYKEIIKDIPKNQFVYLGRCTNSFLQSLTNKKYTWDKLKTDMALKCLFSGKEYIHSIGKWYEYMKFLKKTIEDGDFI